MSSDGGTDALAAIGSWGHSERRVKPQLQNDPWVQSCDPVADAGSSQVRTEGAKFRREFRPFACALGRRLQLPELQLQ